MDNTTTGFAPIPPQNQLTLNGTAILDLQAAAKWASFLAIIGFIASGFMAIMGLFAGGIVSNALQNYPVITDAERPMIGTGVTVFYLVIAVVVFILNLFLYQFAARAKRAITINDSLLFGGAISRLKSFFKGVGIVVIVELILFVCLFIFMVIMGVMMASRGVPPTAQ